MEPIRRAIWFVEAHLEGPIDLEQVAGACDLSRFQLSRRFLFVTGQTLTAYIRARRVSEGARRLAAGAAVLPTALSVGYESHEGFSRAFKAVLGTTPEAVRAAGSTQTLTLTEPFAMSDTLHPLSAPTFETIGPLHLAGLRRTYQFHERHQIPMQWQAFAPHLGHIPDATGPNAYGACFQDGADEPDDAFAYLSAAPVTGLANLPDGLVGVSVPARRYAVFSHEGHVATIGGTCAAIFQDGIAHHGLTLDDGPLIMLERYGPGFSPVTGKGDIAVMVPLHD